MNHRAVTLSSTDSVAKAQTELGAWLRAHRVAARKNQRSTGAARGVARANVSRAEATGVRTISTLIRLAAGLDCDVQVRLVPHRRMP